MAHEPLQGGSHGVTDIIEMDIVTQVQILKEAVYSVNTLQERYESNYSFSSWR